MRKIKIYALLIVALSFGLASCQKDDLYRPGGPNSELNADGDNEAPIGDPITDPDSEQPEKDKGDKKGG